MGIITQHMHALHSLNVGQANGADTIGGRFKCVSNYYNNVVYNESQPGLCSLLLALLSRILPFLATRTVSRHTLTRIGIVSLDPATDD